MDCSRSSSNRGKMETMAQTFQPCESCERHVRVDEAACPFCGAVLPADFGETARGRTTTGRGAATRAAILFVGATAAAACSSSTTLGGGDDSGTSEAAPQGD